MCKTMIPFPKKKYDIIYCDPPWRYKRHQYASRSKYEHRPDDQYNTMSFQELSDMPIKDITKDNCVLFMWAVSPLLKECIEVGESWGLKYITVGFVWYKHYPLQGHYTMPDCELCLIFKKGKIPKPKGETNIPQFVSCRKSKHSSKPIEVRYRIDKIFPSQDKIELFARPTSMDKQYFDWDYWGNEVLHENNKNANLANQKQLGLFDEIGV